ncbi:hypothetical protein RI367_000521 [Sorochytrium milnesiophthora]
MKGGYAEDNLVQGAPLFPIFTFHYWHLVDIFIYFSHYRVSIPPPQWTNLAHLHGVQMLGTVIFEWAESAADLNRFLYGREEVDFGDPTLEVDFSSAEAMVELATHYKFDGWLYNIEVRLPGGALQAEHLRQHVAYVYQRLQQAPTSTTVLWYDSVTTGGQLRWQDRLSPLNKPFFDVCSGIFVNYTWEEHYPAWSTTLATAQDGKVSRARDVYTGIDVFGRNTFGGGGFNTHVAMDAIARTGTSAAVFAPGWVYESIAAAEDGKDLGKARMALCREMLMNERKLWMGAPYTRGVNDSVAAYVHRRKTPCLITDEYFDGCCTAMGVAMYIKGKKISEGAWSNHSVQSVLAPLSSEGVQLDFERAFNGGSCLVALHETCLLLDTSVTLHPDSVLWLFCQVEGDGASLTVHLYLDNTTYGSCTFSEQHLRGDAPTVQGWTFLCVQLGSLAGSGRRLDRATLSINMDKPLQHTRHQRVTVAVGEVAVYRPSLRPQDDILTPPSLNHRTVAILGDKGVHQQHAYFDVILGSGSSTGLLAADEGEPVSVWRKHNNNAQQLEFAGICHNDRYRDCIDGSAHGETDDACVTSAQPGIDEIENSRLPQYHCVREMWYAAGAQTLLQHPSSSLSLSRSPRV